MTLKNKQCYILNYGLIFCLIYIYILFLFWIKSSKIARTLWSGDENVAYCLQQIEHFVFPLTKKSVAKII